MNTKKMISFLLSILMLVFYFPSSGMALNLQPVSDPQAVQEENIGINKIKKPAIKVIDPVIRSTEEEDMPIEKVERERSRIYWLLGIIVVGLATAALTQSHSEEPPSKDTTNGAVGINWGPQ